MSDEDYVVVAHNSATASENRIHDDEVAASLGFGGGLVPGVDVFAYLCRPVLDRWGERFLAGSQTVTRFEKPVFDGETVRIETTIGSATDDAIGSATDDAIDRGPDGGRGLHVAAVTGSGRCAWLRTELVDGIEAPPIGPAGPLPHPDHRPPASPTTLRPGTVLGQLEVTFSEAELIGYLDEVLDPGSPVLELGLVHPAWLLRLANRVLSATVSLGPWIHVGSEIRQVRPVRVGETVAVRGTVDEVFERRGHRFVTLTATLVDEAGTAPWVAAHTAIYEPRQLRSGAR